MLETLKKKLNDELLNIEHRDDLSTDQKIARIVTLFSATCAAVAVQPIPFADYFTLTPLQAWMGERLSAIRGMPLTGEGAGQLLKELAGVCGLGLVGQQFVLGCYKTFVPFLGGVTTVPLVFGATYAIGHVMDAYLVAKARGQRMDPAQLRALWARMKAEGERQGKDSDGRH